MFETTLPRRLLRSMFSIALAMTLDFDSSGISMTSLRAQDDSQPFTVYVDQEGVTARCGPGDDYYRTDPLRHGQALEVYIEAEDGWLGIRPPEGSFCWLPADAIKLSPGQDFGIVQEDNSLAWIGTHLGKANKYLWQVQLSKGEEVAILGRAKREGPDGQPKLWFRIVPPAGEFRWVHRDQVVDNPEMLLREKPASNSRVAGQPTLAPDEETFAEAVPSPTESASTERALPLPAPTPDDDPQAIGSGVDSNVNAIAAANNQEIARAYEAPLVAFTTRPSVRSIGETDPRPVAPQPALVDAFSSRTASSPPTSQSQLQPTQLQLAQRSPKSNQQVFVEQSRVVIPTAVVPVSNVVATPRSNDRSIDSVQLELSRLMSRSAPAIDVEPVLEAATFQSRTVQSASDRQRALMIVKRAQEYQQVARRRDRDPASTFDDFQASASYPEPIQPSVQPSMVLQIPRSDETPAEMVGYLVQVFSARPDSPPFALTDKQGRTTFYISPAPGINLRRNLNQYVTVRGAAGYMTGLDTPHIIASGAVRTLEP